MTPTAPHLPAAPRGVPAWLLRLVALLIAIAGPLIAFIDPGATRFTPGIKAVIILAFLAVAAAIFLVHTVLAAVHEYGFTLAAASHVYTDTETEVTQLWPEMKKAYIDAKPALDQVAGAQPAIDALSKDVADLKARAATADLDPQAVASALEAATGMTFPRAGADPAGITAAQWPT